MNSVLYSVFISLLIKMSVAALFVLGIKALFRTKLSAAMHSLIWVILCVQLVFCLGNVKIETNASIYNYIPQSQKEMVIDAGEEINTESNEKKSGVDIRNVIAFTWASGGAALALWYIAVFMSYKRKIKKYRNVSDTETLDLCGELCEMMDIKHKVRLCYGEAAQTLDDTIIIPYNYSGGELRQILLHELCHYKNKDGYKIWMAIAVLCINWFNPIIWFAFSQFRTDIEMMCDDRVLKITNSKKEYAQVLVKSSMQKAHFIPGATSVNNGKHEVIKRVKRIVLWKKKKPVWVVAAVCVCVTMSCICLTDAVTVAVENNVEAASAPEPIEVIPTIISFASATEAPVPEKTADTVKADTAQNKQPNTDVNSARQRNARNTEAQANTYIEENNYVSEPVQTQENITDSQNVTSSASTAADTTDKNAENAEAVSDVNTDTKNENIQNENSVSDSVNTSQENPVKTELDEIGKGSSKNEVYAAMGKPESISSNGTRETYSLEDGTKAVLQYQGDTVESGYIISGDEEN